MYIICYLVLVNIVSFAAMYADKQRAIDGRWRLSERFLFLLAILGGSVGAILGMQLFRHKTKHWYFVFGMPAILVLQIVAAVIVKLYMESR